MAIKKPDWSKLKETLANVYRFQIVDEKHYDVKLVFELKPVNVLVVSGLIIAFFTFINFMLIAYTPLKQYIPGYGSISGRSQIISMSMKTEELESKANAQQKYIQNLQNILNEKVVIDAVKSDVSKSKVDSGILSIKTENESKFVQTIEKGLQNAELMESVRDTKSSILSNLTIQSPVSGKILAKFTTIKPSISIEAVKDEEVKAILPGKVILTGEIPNEGAFIIIQTENQLVYVLKNNSQLLKKTGNFVQIGETLGKVGMSDTYKKPVSTLELWYKGQAIDPLTFIK